MNYGVYGLVYNSEETLDRFIAIVYSQLGEPN